MPFLRAAAAGATLQLAATMLQLHGSQAFGGGAKPTFSSIKCRPDSRDAGVTCMHPDMSGVGSASIGCCDSSNRNSQSAAASFGPGHFNANRSLYTCKYGSSANGYRPCEMVPPSCVDIPGFKDAYGTCATYAAHSWCDPSGKTGMNWNPAWGALDPAATKKCCQCGGGNKQGHSVTAAPTSSPTARPTGGKTSSACTLASPINTGCTGKAAGAFCGTHLAYSAKYRGKMAFPFRCTKDSQQRYPLVCQYCPNGPIETCGGNSAPKAPCVFPFVYKGKTYNKQCTTQDTVTGPWCYTQHTTSTTSSQPFGIAKWGYCNPESCNQS